MDCFSGARGAVLDGVGDWLRRRLGEALGTLAMLTLAKLMLFGLFGLSGLVSGDHARSLGAQKRRCRKSRLIEDRGLGLDDFGDFQRVVCGGRTFSFGEKPLQAVETVCHCCLTRKGIWGFSSSVLKFLSRVESSTTGFV